MKTIFSDNSVMFKDKPCGEYTVLKGFTAPFTARAVQNLMQAGYMVQPLAEPLAPLSLHNDYVGKIRARDIQAGRVYLYPSYGSVSRSGLLPSVPSMDQIGVSAPDAQQAYAVFNDMREKTDQNSAPPQNRAVKADAFKTDLPVQEVFDVLATAELAFSLSRYDGVKFGYRAPQYKNLEELYVNSRTQGFTYEVKRQIIWGNLVLSGENYLPYYDKAMRLRRLIQNQLLSAFNAADIVHIHGCTAPDFTLSPLTGCPSITFLKEGRAVTALAKPCCEADLFVYAQREGV
ncbi:MAG: amidase family protein [Firmicutes bacterium]|nr:amidase family protein [Bacillota bacterium]